MNTKQINDRIDFLTGRIDLLENRVDALGTGKNEWRRKTQFQNEIAGLKTERSELMRRLEVLRSRRA